MQVLILQGGGGGTESLTSSQVIGGCSSADQILSRQNPRGLGDLVLESSAGADTPGEDDFQAARGTGFGPCMRTGH